ncbi:MAG: CmcI family methyltransferase [Polaromonas sp.]|nr:CmcI family methyltransferase [Polaromonas sp.]
MNTVQRVLRKLKQKRDARHLDPAVNPASTEFEVNNWLLSEFIVKKLVPVVGMHPYPIAELQLMAAAVCRFKPEQVFEWGTNIGKSARIFFETGKRFNIPMEIHSVDLPDDIDHQEHPRSDRGRLVRGRAGVTLHQADGLATAIALHARNPGKRTLVFIDGDHSHASVLRELQGITQAMPQAAILLHDTFYQSDDAGYNTGPFRAIEETLAMMPGRYRRIAVTTGLPGMTLLYPA